MTIDFESVGRWNSGSLEDLSLMVGKTLSLAERSGDELHLAATDGTLVRLWHEQDCCESVSIEDVDGDLHDLLGSPLTMAEAVSSDDAPPPASHYPGESFTWTFYKFATLKGYVTIRWYGTSNGYYREGVSVAVQLPKVVSTAAAFEVVCDSRDRETWLAERRKGIGSSDAAAILGISPWASPLSVYADKKGLIPERDDSERMRWGTLLEPIVLAEYGKETGHEVQPCSTLCRSAERSWQLATPDAWRFRKEDPGTPLPFGVIELKTTGMGWSWTEGAPPHVVAQVQHQLAVTGLSWASVVVLVNGSRLLWIDLPRDDAFIARLNDAEADFWERVEKDLPPAPDGTEASREALKLLYPRDTGAVIALPGEFIDLDREREELLRAKATVEKDLEVANQRIKAALADATEGTLASGVRYSYRTQQRAEHVVKAAEFRVLRRHEKRAAG